MEKQELRLIVRVANKDINGRYTIGRALDRIKGIGDRMSKAMAVSFSKETGLDKNIALGYLNEEQVRKLEAIVYNPEKHMPAWMVNRRRDYETGKNKHLIMSDLDLTLRNDVLRMNETKSYRGLRHSWGLTVRGQRTKSTHRGKGPVVGVMKKDNKAAPAASAKKEEKPAKK